MPRLRIAILPASWWVFPATLLLLLVWRGEAPPGGAPAGAQPGPVEPRSPLDALGLRMVLSHAFYGSTPSLAWSPDGQRLAFNAAYEYFGHDEELGTHAASVGLWVYERDGEAARQLVTGQRYHPAWVGDAQIATGCSPYEDCVAGLYLTDLTGADRRALETDVYHTVASTDSQVLFYNGFHDYTQWNRFDVASAARETGVSSNCSWEPPPELVTDQCIQRVGPVAVSVEAGSGLWIQYGATDPILLDSMPPFEFSSGAWDCGESHSGPVAPCLSPDARQVAYVAQGPTSLVLRVHELPEVAAVEGVLGEEASFESLADEALRFWNDEPELEPTPLGPVVVFAPAATHTPTEQPLLASTTPVVGSEPARPYLAFDFFGDTPSLAWSPDGRRLAFSAAFAPSTYMGTEGGLSEVLGVYVAEPATASIRRVTPEMRFHPVWTDDATVASSCTYGMDCTVGLALTDLSGATRMGVGDDVPNLAPAAGGGLLYWDWNAGTWRSLDVTSGEVGESTPTACSWEPPPGLAGSQCLQEVGDVRAWVQAGLGLYVQVGSGAATRLDPSPPWVFEGYAWGCVPEERSGPLPPCVSPDGRYVAYVARGLTGSSLHVHELPR